MNITDERKEKSKFDLCYECTEDNGLEVRTNWKTGEHGQNYCSSKHEFIEYIKHCSRWEAV